MHAHRARRASIKWRAGADRQREVRALRSWVGRPPAAVDVDEELRRLGYFRAFCGAAAGVASVAAPGVFSSFQEAVVVGALVV